MKCVLSISALFLLMVLTGCVSSDPAVEEQQVLTNRVGALTNEVARLDAALRETSDALKLQQERNQQLEAQLAATASKAVTEAPAASGAGIYRTPSGFELPSRDVQIALKNAGYYNGEIDGKIGPSTRTAIRAFQEANGLTADGVCGKGTWDKLKENLSTK